jgi:hypothetical protein
MAGVSTACCSLARFLVGRFWLAVLFICALVNLVRGGTIEQWEPYQTCQADPSLTTCRALCAALPPVPAMRLL